MMNTMLFVSSRGGRKNGTKRLTEIERTLRYVTYVTQGCYHTINGYIPFPNQCRTYKTSSALQPEG